jgi:SNF2 family DNA or RNA helicase
MDVSQAWGHQRSAQDWLMPRRFGHLNHQVGCGKTRTALMALADKKIILVVCPIAVGPAWAKQGRLFDTGRRFVVAVKGTSAQRLKAIRDGLAGGGSVAIVINYDSVYRGDIGKLIQATAWDAIVCDESHRIKSGSGRASKFLWKLGKAHPDAKRICLTGTPTPNNPLDWFGQFRFLDDSILGTSERSLRERLCVLHPQYKGWILDWKRDGLQALAARIDEHVHRVQAADVLTLPEAIHTHIEIELNSVVRAFYDVLEEEMIARIASGEVVTAANRMVVTARLHLAASGHAKPDDGDRFHRICGEPDKRGWLKDWLEDFPSREPLVVFVRFLEDLREVAEACEASGRTVSLLCGHKKELEDWQDGKTDVIVVQQQAGGAGVDLTRASYCVFYSLSHSLGDFEQAVGRLHRPGQTKCCRYYHVVAKSTIDEAIYQALRDKADVAESVFSRLTRRVGAHAGH